MRHLVPLSLVCFLLACGGSPPGSNKNPGTSMPSPPQITEIPAPDYKAVAVSSGVWLYFQHVSGDSYVLTRGMPEIFTFYANARAQGRTTTLVEGTDAFIPFQSFLALGDAPWMIYVENLDAPSGVASYQQIRVEVAPR